jgi:hypothetical protein
MIFLCPKYGFGFGIDGSGHNPRVHFEFNL